MGLIPGLRAADARVLLAVSRLERQKGIDVAIGRWLEIRPRHPQAVLLVLGQGSLDRSSRGRRDLARRCPSAGPRRDVAAWLRRAELLVHPARWEGFGLALLEAMLA